MEKKYPRIKEAMEYEDETKSKKRGIWDLRKS